MKNKSLNTLLVVGLTASMLSGCGDFDPSKEEVVEVYGPPIVNEEVYNEDESESSNEDMEDFDDFEAEDEMSIICAYGPNPNF